MILYLFAKFQLYSILRSVSRTQSSFKIILGGCCRFLTGLGNLPHHISFSSKLKENNRLKNLASIIKHFIKKTNTRKSRKYNFIKKKTRTKLAVEIFICYAINKLNKNHPEIITEEKMHRFKKEIMSWIKKKIKIKP